MLFCFNVIFICSFYLNVLWDHAGAEEDSDLIAAEWVLVIKESWLEGSSPREDACRALAGWEEPAHGGTSMTHAHSSKSQPSGWILTLNSL